jgi:hypothetical protein
MKETDCIFEPFAGEGNWVRSFPHTCSVIQTEIVNGTDYRSINLDEVTPDWVITNPPFRLENDDPTKKRFNSFYHLIEYFAGRTNKGFAFLANDSCFSTLTPPRLKKLYNEKNMYLYKVVVCSVKKWRGRYFFLIFRNRCCKGCGGKKEACSSCPDKENQEPNEEPNQEPNQEPVVDHSHEHEHEHEHEAVERYDFLDFIEGTY